MIAFPNARQLPVSPRPTSHILHHQCKNFGRKSGIAEPPTGFVCGCAKTWKFCLSDVCRLLGRQPEIDYSLPSFFNFFVALLLSLCFFLALVGSIQRLSFQSIFFRGPFLGRDDLIPGHAWFEAVMWINGSYW